MTGKNVRNVQLFIGRIAMRQLKFVHKSDVKYGHEDCNLYGWSKNVLVNTIGTHDLGLQPPIVGHRRVNWALIRMCENQFSPPNTATLAQRQTNWVNPQIMGC